MLAFSLLKGAQYRFHDNFFFLLFLSLHTFHVQCCMCFHFGLFCLHMQALLMLFHFTPRHKTHTRCLDSNESSAMFFGFAMDFPSHSHYARAIPFYLLSGHTHSTRRCRRCCHSLLITIIKSYLEYQIFISMK